jgi:protein TonB
VLEEPPEVLATDRADAIQPLGEPDPGPRREEPLVPPDHPAMEFPQPPVLPRPSSIHPTTLIPRGPDGDPRGNPDGSGAAVIPSGHLDNPPRTRSQVAPVYPFEARPGGRMGEVLVEFTVDETGRVLRPHVLRSSDPLFESPTLRAVAKWRFEPGRKDGRTVRFRMVVPVHFTLGE